MIPTEDKQTTFGDRTYGRILVRELPPMRVACYRTVSPTPERDSIRYMKQWAEEHHLQYSSLRTFGFAVPVSETELQVGLWGYECWTSVPDAIESTVDVKIKHLAAGKYAMMRIRDPFVNTIEKITNGWLRLHDWVTRSPYTPDHNLPNRYLLEEIREDESTTYVDLYFPLGRFKILNTHDN